MHPLCFTAAGFGEIELNNQQIHTGTVQPMEAHIETGNVTQQQGVYVTAYMKAYPANTK